ncbi:hypothetical protein AOLI_G00260440 [Acnodon oligacanthus]
MAEEQGHWRSGYLSAQQLLDELDLIDSRSEAVQLRSRSEACWTPEPSTKLFFFDPWSAVTADPWGPLCHLYSIVDLHQLTSSALHTC